MAVKLKRQIHKHPFPLPDGTVVADIPFEDVSHVPGQSAAIRFFDLHSKDDLVAMREILRGRLSRKWMDETSISKTEYHRWAGELTDASFLFAVLDARMENHEEIKKVRGFVNIYSEREEKFRVKRMERLGLINALGQRYMLEISFAARPRGEGVQSGSGLIASAVRQSCLQVKTLLGNSDTDQIQIFAFCDLGNIGSQRTVEAAGFVKRGMMRYDSDSEDESILYFLDWSVLQEKIRERMLDVLAVS